MDVGTKYRLRGILFLIVAGSLSGNAVHGTALGKRGSLELQVKEADLVVVGTLEDAREDIPFAPLKIGRVLKGEVEWGSTWDMLVGSGLAKRDSSRVDVMFYEGTNADSLGAPETSPLRASAWVGELRIWLLVKHKALKCYYVNYPDDCLSIESLTNVEEYVAEERQ